MSPSAHTTSGGLNVCISSPGRVLALDETGATIDLDGRVRRASTLLLPDLAVGDHVLVAAGTVIRRLDATEMAELNELLAIARDDTSTTPERSLT
jgi:hydrogenase assembly chaperone HypC/HupF